MRFSFFIVLAERSKGCVPKSGFQPFRGASQTMKDKSRKIVDDLPIVLYPRLAKLIGINEAVILQQVHFLLGMKSGGRKINGSKWIWNTVTDWMDHFPFMGERTVRQAIKNLEKAGLLLSCQPDGMMSRKKYYRVDYDAVDRLKLPEPAKSAASNRQKLPHSDMAESAASLTETTSETPMTETTRNEETNGDKPPVCDFEIPTCDEVNRYWSEKYGRSANGKRGHFKEAAQAWWAINNSRGWRTPNGGRIRHWKKAMDSYIQHYKPPVHDDETKWKELQDHADEIEMDRSAFRQFVTYRDRDGWLARNAATGKMEPIRDRRANMEAFWEAIKECRGWQ